MAEKALEGIRVVYLGLGIAGPFAQRYLSCLGAEVIRVIAGSRGREEGAAALPFEPKRGLVLDFPGVGELSAGYLGLGLELKHPKGIAIFKELIKKTDVVITSYAASVPKRLGWDYESLKAVKPDIIMIQTPAFGTTGPYKDYDLWGSNIHPMTGINRTCGYEDLPEPEGLAYGGQSVTDFMAGYSAAFAVMMALDYRARTGKGQHIDQAMLDVTVPTMSPIILDYTANGVVAERHGNRNANFAPHGAYRCRGNDRWCAIAVKTEEEWQGFCRAAGSLVWASDPRFATMKSRLENVDELDRLIEEYTNPLDAYEVMFNMQREGVAAGVVQNTDDLLFRDVHMQARGGLTKVPVKKRGASWTYQIPVRMSLTPPALPRGQATIAQDNDYILKDVLGMTDEQIAQLVEEKVVTPPTPGDPVLENRSLSQRWTGRLGSSLPRADELKWS